jgi:hypothetical protein
MISFKKVLLTLALMTPEASLSFMIPQNYEGSVITKIPSSSSSPSNLFMAPKGFGKEEEAAPQKVKSETQIQREQAASQYDKIAATGGQEYAIFVRQFGSDDESWLPCGSIAVKRGEQVSNAIFGNEEPLKAAIVRTYPKLKGYESEFEYGFNLKIYPDEPVEVALKQNGSTGPSLGNWMSNLLSPIDASNVKQA